MSGVLEACLSVVLHCVNLCVLAVLLASWDLSYACGGRGFVGSLSHCQRANSRNEEAWLDWCWGSLGTEHSEQLCFARAGRTPDGAFDPQKRSNIPGGASHIMRVRNKSCFDQPAS